jgi:DnaB helicase-like protein/AAA domain-containing protein
MPAHLPERHTRELTEIERTLPHNAEAERVLLGAVLLDNHALEAAKQTLAPVDFFLTQHRKVFQSMIELAEKQQAIDVITLMEDLTRRGELESAGGVAYLSQLADGLPKVTNAGHYARIVADNALRRNVIYAARNIEERAFAIDDTGALVGNALEQFSGLKLASDPAGWRSMFDGFEEFEDAGPLSFAIRGFVQNDAATMIGGLAGDGKTLTLLSIAKALLVGKGSKLWDLFEVEEDGARVVYLIPESARRPFAHRLRLFGIYPYLAPDNERLLVRTLSKGPTPSLADARILHAAKNAHVILDTAVRFGEGDENDVDDNRTLANDIFALLAAGARSVIAAHHAPKSFEKENVMRLENVLRGSSDIGAMVATAWGLKQIDPAENIIHIENVKARDFQPSGPFQIIGRPYIDEEGDFRLHKKPDECGTLMDEQEPERDKGGGATLHAREARSANIELLRTWLKTEPSLTSDQLSARFKQAGINVGASAIRKYRKQV